MVQSTRLSPLRKFPIPSAAVRAIGLAGLALLLTLGTGGCVYRMTVQQGNFLDPKQVSQLQVGMTRSQVRFLLGTPMLPDAFDRDRWDYLYYEKIGRLKKPDQRRLTVFFDGDQFSRAEGDEMPTEAEFVATLGSRASGRKVPQLEATEAQLERYPAPAHTEDAPAPAPADSAGARHYPPLDAAQ